METVVATGQWRYDGVAPTTVQVVVLDHDFWYEIGADDGTLEPGEAPQLNADGQLYYLRHRPDDTRPFWPDSPGFPTLAEAVAAAESAVPGPVVWRETTGRPA